MQAHIRFLPSFHAIHSGLAVRHGIHLANSNRYGCHDVPQLTYTKELITNCSSVGGNAVYLAPRVSLSRVSPTP
jgi:hypothetical protein